MITLGIQRPDEAGDYRVYWRENGRDDEGKAYYTNAPDDAVFTMLGAKGMAESQDQVVEINQDQYTQRLMAQYQNQYLDRIMRSPKKETAQGALEGTVAWQMPSTETFARRGIKVQQLDPITKARRKRVGSECRQRRSW